MANFYYKGSEISMDTQSNKNKLKDKKIVFLGDSIHAYSQWDGVTIPYLIEYENGCKCYNWCQGGMTMAYMDNPSYDAYSCIGMVEAITSGEYTLQETYVNDNHGTAQGNFVSQLAEMKSLDFSTVDMVIIEFGTNDNYKLVPLDTESDKFDTHTTGGALRTSIKKLLELNPKLKIFVCNVQRGVEGRRNEGTELVYISEDRNGTIEAVCSEYNIPVIDVFNGLWLNEQTESIILHDGIHRTHEGKVRQANLIANMITQYI